MICPECDSDVAHKPGCSRWEDDEANDRVMWLSFMDDTYLADVFRWLAERRVKWLVVEDGRELWLSRGSEVWDVPDGAWIIEDGDSLRVVPTESAVAEGVSPEVPT